MQRYKSNYKEVAKQMLRIHEGLRLKPYLCTSGKLTIGYGRNLEGNGISEEEAEYLFNNDVDRVDSELTQTFEWYNSLSIARKAVIIDMTFNLGIRGLSRFKKTISYIESKDYESASMEMLDSLWAKQVGKRAIKLSQMMKNNKE